jgi:hypothetical protein
MCTVTFGTLDICKPAYYKVTNNISLPSGVYWYMSTVSVIGTHSSFKTIFYFNNGHSHKLVGDTIYVRI